MTATVYANTITATVDKKSPYGDKTLYRVKLHLKQGTNSAIGEIDLSTYLTDKVFDGAMLYAVEVSPDTTSEKYFTVSVKTDTGSDGRRVAYLSDIKNDEVSIKQITETSRSFVYDLKVDVTNMGDATNAVAIYFYLIR
jgi:hypothetical protein